MEAKTFFLVAPLFLGGCYVAGMFGDGASYGRQVERSPEAVIRALDDLDVGGSIRSHTGERSTIPASLFRKDVGGDHISWWVMSGDRVAVKMTAHVTPMDGGRRSRVTTEVERGDAPDDFVSPVFRSEAVAGGLFKLALEDELNKLAQPVMRLDRDACRDFARRLSQSGELMPIDASPGDISGLFGNLAKLVMQSEARSAELRRYGCSPSDADDGTFAWFGSHRESGMEWPEHPRGVNFEPGEPMTDLSRYNRRYYPRYSSYWP